MGFYEGKDGPAIAKAAKSGNDGFKKGGKAEKKREAKKKGGECMEKPARATGGSVFSSAKSGKPRGAAPKPY